MTIALDRKTSRRLSSSHLMAADAFRPGQVRDAILAHLKKHGESSVADMCKSASATLGRKVPASSVRSYLNLNVGEVFERVGWGRYRLKKR